MTSTTARGLGGRLLAHGLVVVGLGADVVAVVLDPPTTLAALFPWGLAAALLPVVTLIVGWLLALRRPHLSLAWLLITIGLLVSTETAIGAVGTGLAASHPAAARWLLWYGGTDQWGWIPPIGLLFTQVPLRFPDGRLPSPRWRWFSAFSVAALAATCAVFSTVDPTLVPTRLVNPTAGAFGDPGGALTVLTAVLTAAAFAGSVASLVVRYRRSDAIARAQLRWIFWAAAVVAGLLVLSWLGDPSTPGLPGALDAIVSSAAALAYSLVPLAILVAVLRHGLYSIDRIISRTAAYSIVTAVVVAVYGGVVLLASLLPDLHAVGVAAATLVAAAVFLPVLRVVRRAIDRVFDREKYDADRVVERFGARIRDGADPQTAGADLLEAVDLTLQPTAVGLWLTEHRRGSADR